MSKTTNAKNNIENLINHGKIFFGNSDDFLVIKRDLERIFSQDISKLKKAIFTYYSSQGLNFENFRKADSFNGLIDILRREEGCLYCLLKELGKSYDFFKENRVDCEILKEKAENTKEINGIILRIDLIGNSKLYDIGGYLRFSSGSFEPLNPYESVEIDIISDIIYQSLKDRRTATNIELQLILPNELFHITFRCKNKKIKMIRRLSLRIDNYAQLEIDAIRYWQRNSQFYIDHKTDRLDNDFIYILDEDGYIDEFQELDSDKHVCLLSNSCLSGNIRDIYDYGVPFAFYSFSRKCNIINNLNFINKQVKDMKDTILKFMRRNAMTHFIYDDYNDLDFLKIEGAEDEYI